MGSRAAALVAGIIDRIEDRPLGITGYITGHVIGDRRDGPETARGHGTRPQAVIPRCGDPCWLADDRRGRALISFQAIRKHVQQL
jgi:hypothetical protein